MGKLHEYTEWVSTFNKMESIELGEKVAAEAIRIFLNKTKSQIS